MIGLWPVAQAESEPFMPAARAVLRQSLVLLLSLSPLTGLCAMFEDLPSRDVHAVFSAAEAAGRVGIARKTRPVDARPARVGEIIITSIAREGVETQSKPAAAGDWVVRNRCPETGNEAYLVKAAVFAERYKGPFSAPDEEGWREFRPVGLDLRFFVLSKDDGAFRFMAPWGEQMPARPGDAIVKDLSNPQDTYRVAGASFACTYEIVTTTQR